MQIALPEEVVGQEIIFLEELLRWNRQINLTAISDPGEALEKHLLDSLVLVRYLPAVNNLLDMGSGGGFPGIPLAIARRELQVTSVDSVGKKINFQNHVKRLLKLSNLVPIHARLEELSTDLSHPSRFDAVVVRALASLPQILKLAKPYLAMGGQLVVMKGPEGERELLQAKEGLSTDGYQDEPLIKYQLPFSGAERTLIRLRRFQAH